ncbi:MAG: NDP-sugar synthase [Patescibacteria group bacterium]|nr:NDP-sugar synthase [Patescibacteria group bacterium]
MQAIIIAGGKGTRIRSITPTVPKLLLKLNDKPLIDYMINHLKRNCCDDIIICAGYLGDKIKEHIDRNNYGLVIRQSMESKPLGTAGALHLIKNMLKNEFFILYGDVYTTINLRKMLQFHKDKKAVVTAAIHKSSHPRDSDLVEFNSDFRITKILRKPHAQIPKNPHNLAALYLANRNIKKYFTAYTPSDIVHDLLPGLLDENVPIYGYNTKEFMMDIGTPERLKKAEKLLHK